ncbi:MAG: hypothetical protein AB8W37_10880 [Arsenophonus endosymbiont of Dermacentor nuttalli]
MVRWCIYHDENIGNRLDITQLPVFAKVAHTEHYQVLALLVKKS